VNEFTYQNWSHFGSRVPRSANPLQANDAKLLVSMSRTKVLSCDKKFQEVKAMQNAKFIIHNHSSSFVLDYPYTHARERE
jgi:hypothetical protein